MKQNEQVTESLVARCRKGDRIAFKHLYDQYSNAMFNICLRMMNNVHDAEDILQEAFFQVFKNLESFRGEATIGSWIRSIVVNKCLNELKKKKIRFTHTDDLEIETEEAVDEADFTYHVESVKQAIKTLPDGYRIVLNLYLFEDYSHRQIAEKLGISESTAKTQYMRAKQKVREAVRKN